MFYWKITEYDGTETQIPPMAVEIVKQKLDAKQPIHTTNGTILAAQIKSFRPTERLYVSPTSASAIARASANEARAITEGAAQAFNEELLLANGAIICKWVKKEVPQIRWEKFYSQHIGYRKLFESAGFVTVAYRLPVHMIHNKDICTEDEIRVLTSYS